MKRISIFVLSLLLLMPLLSFGASAADGAKADLGLSCASAVLMEAKTGTILYAHNEKAALPPASVTKVMTLLLTMEAIKNGNISWQDTVSVSEHAASMGGSQIYLEPGETMSVTDLVKSVVIASANDAAAALAEHIAGSEEAFVMKMNERALELGMVNTHFENTNGLDDTVQNHVISAEDIAIMSRALIAYPEILEFSSTWMDTVRGGAFTLTNTNRLVRFYPGATGLKTGSTAKAKFCISATAERDGVSLIAVIMGAESRDSRNEQAKKLLDYGFAHYGVYTDADRSFAPIEVHGGTANSAKLTAESFSAVLPKEKLASVRAEIDLPPYISAPMQAGTKVGCVRYTLDGKVIGESAVKLAENVEKISFGEIFIRLLSAFTLS